MEIVNSAAINKPNIKRNIMAGIIILDVKKANPKRLAEFYNIVDDFVEKHGFSIMDQDPKAYLNLGKVSQQEIKNIITAIKNTKDYRTFVNAIYSTHSLVKN